MVTGVDEAEAPTGIFGGGHPGLTLGAPTRQPYPQRYSRDSTVRRLLVVTDVGALTFAFLAIELVGGFRHGDASFLKDLLLLVFAIPTWLAFAQAHNLYHADSRRADHSASEELVPIMQMATLWSWSILLLVSLTGLRPVTVPKLALFWLFTIVLLVALREATRTWARRREWYLQNAVAIGPPAETAEIVAKLRRHPEYGINLVACVNTAPNPEDGQSVTPLGASPQLVPMVGGDIDFLIDLIKEEGIDRVIIAPNAPEIRGSAEFLCRLTDLDVHIDLIPNWSDAVGRRLDFHELEGLPLLTVPRTVTRRFDVLEKRLFDLVTSLVGIFVLVPVMAVCAILIKLDSPGPVLFRQRRVGRDEKPFELLKFRSMYVDADIRKQEVAFLNFHSDGTKGRMFKIRDDPRITRVGRLLRRTSLDELPQLFNVLRGDMSMVGPRPLIEREDRQVAGRFRRRLTSAPGLTGPWQIHGRSDIPFDDMISLDYLYVTNWSLWGDVKLVLRTAAAVVRGQGAY